MKNKTTFDLRFIIGVTFGFITRHDKSLNMSKKVEVNEDYEQSILYFLKDGGVIRYNNITTKPKFNAPGGLGQDRFERNKKAAEYLTNKYPDIVSRKDRDDGTPEVRLANCLQNLTTQKRKQKGLLLTKPRNVGHKCANLRTVHISFGIFWHFFCSKMF
jgi:hypothetical protein